MQGIACSAVTPLLTPAPGAPLEGVLQGQDSSMATLHAQQSPHCFLLLWVHRGNVQQQHCKLQRLGAYQERCKAKRRMATLHAQQSSHCLLLHWERRAAATLQGQVEATPALQGPTLVSCSVRKRCRSVGGAVQGPGSSRGQAAAGPGSSRDQAAAGARQQQGPGSSRGQAAARKSFKFAGV